VVQKVIVMKLGAIMEKTLKKVVCILAIMILSMSLVACSSSSTSKTVDSKVAQPEKKVIKIACMSTFEPMIDWLQEGLAPLGYEVKAVMFDANQLPATALKDGDVDGLIHNHLPWIKTFSQLNNCDLQMPQPYLAYGRTAVYSTKHKTIDAIPQNARIAVPGDPSNMDKSLLILKDMGLITLGERSGKFYTLLNIKDNPKNINLIETEISQTIRSINDVDAAITPSYRAWKAGIDPASFLYEDPDSQNYQTGLVVNGKDVNAKWVQEALKVTQSAEFKAKFNAYYQGTYVLYNK